MRLDTSSLMLAALLAAGVTAAATRHADGIWLAVPAALVLVLTLRRGRVSWAPLALAMPLVALVVMASKVDSRGWHTVIPVTLLWIRLYSLPWGGDGAVSTSRAMLLVGAPAIALAVFGAVQHDVSGRQGGSFPWLVWLLCVGLINQPVLALPAGCRASPRQWALVGLLVPVVAACGFLQWTDVLARRDARCLESEEWVLGFLDEIARAQGQLSQASQDLADILESLGARSEAGIDVLGPTATVQPYPFDPRVVGLDRDRDGTAEHPTLAELAGHLESPAVHYGPFDIVSHGDIDLALHPDNLCLYRSHGYYFLTYLQDDRGAWAPERWPAELLGLEDPPRAMTDPKALLRWRIYTGTWQPTPADIDGRERGVLLYAWPVAHGHTGRQTFLVGSAPTVLATDTPHSGLEQMPDPPESLGGDPWRRVR